MELIYYPDKETVTKDFGTDELYIMAISFDGKRACISLNDDSFEHHILLAKCGINETEIDKHFRIIFDNVKAEWTFVCPSDYKNITYKTKRITAFYNDGFNTISSTLSSLGYYIDLTIPKRYKCQFRIMSDETYQ